MGVTGLWTVVQPCARPIKLETLNKKRLAVDASIWIYQFLKAVRDQEGNALHNSHVVGFFRRICKLLFFGIKPVFVFDGGAPALKRQTISNRKARREGRREDAVRTAGKLLAVQIQRRAEEEERKRREERGRPSVQVEEEELPENLVYVEELQMNAQERQQNRRFKKKDQYHLPDLDVSLEDMGAPNDPRIMTREELEEYAKQFNAGEDINLYDFSKIDFDSPFFVSLPATDRYNILNAARLRSRLRMGYSKDQLDIMFPDRMAFSRFQIERVKERNELTQRLMNLNGMNGQDGTFNGVNRVAGEKGKEYILVKNDGVEGGWALGVVSNTDEGQQNKPIDVDEWFNKDKVEENADEDEWEDEEFEDVPIEGLNRLPKAQKMQRRPPNSMDYQTKEILKQRQDLYEFRQGTARKRDKGASEPAEQISDALFFSDQEDEQWEYLAQENAENLPQDNNSISDDEDEDLRRAIAMSLEQLDDNDIPKSQPLEQVQEPIKINPAINKKKVQDDRDGNANDSDGMDFEAFLKEARSSKYQLNRGPEHLHFPQPETKSVIKPTIESTAPEQFQPIKSLFSGPLPFESIDLGESFLGKKKARRQKLDMEAGEFEKDDDESTKEKEPVPPWFSGGIQDHREDFARLNEQEIKEARAGQIAQEDRREGILRQNKTCEVIDLDGIQIRSDEEKDIHDQMEDINPVDSESRMTDKADLTYAEPPKSSSKPPQSNRERNITHDLEVIKIPSTKYRDQNGPEDEEIYEWEDSDQENDIPKSKKVEEPVAASEIKEPSNSKSSSPLFEDVDMSDTHTLMAQPTVDRDQQPIPESIQLEDDFAQPPLRDEMRDDEPIYSDPEDEDLLRALALEAEEHARFASTLNSKTVLENQADYERELKQLRNQQKRDRRDADEVSHIMISECQQLLTLFGLPYITAPMEAEAQCAELVRLGLVDGIVTDDSDVFLFGGTRVYKNMFNQSKFVECYLLSDLEKEYSLSRDHLINFAHLLGSDYTEGIPTVGPVTALEILAEFPSLDSFRHWWTPIQQSHIRPNPTTPHYPFYKKFKRNTTKLFLPSSFPDKRVNIAYENPEVDSDPQPFQWGIPDLDALRTFLMVTVGWTGERTDEVLVPVIRDMNRRQTEGTQSNITRFFGGGVGVGAGAPHRKNRVKSKRLDVAFSKLQTRAERGGQHDREEEEHDDVTEGDAMTLSSKGKRKKARKASGKRRVRVSSMESQGEGDTDEGEGEDVDADADVNDQRPKRKRARGKSLRKGKKGGGEDD
ncbi:MAG: DNA repair protein rad2 [Cirrosporium novae-zelandiae]|nr:MAG: DNA repair protein rad2 [Cirrosporium novae-zelandiae]